MRSLAKEIIGDQFFFEVYLQCSFEKCAERDVKNLYYKMSKGQLTNFIGVDIEFDIPNAPDVIVDTEYTSIEECIKMILSKMKLPTFSSQELIRPRTR